MLRSTKAGDSRSTWKVYIFIYLDESYLVSYIFPQGIEGMKDSHFCIIYLKFVVYT